MPPRRRRAPKKTRKRSFRRLGVAIVAVAALVLIVVVVARQYAGYFTHRKQPPRISARTTPQPATTSTPLPAGSPSPTPSPAASVSPPANAPRLALIIDDCGYSIPHDVRFLKLPIPITLSILPLTPHGKQVELAAEAAGKAVMLHIPMEPDSTTANPGPGAIRTEMTDAQIVAQLTADIASLPPLPGANNHMGSKASSDERVMRDVMSVLKHDNMFFIDSLTAMTSVGASTAQEAGVPTAKRDVFLDDQVNVAYVEGQLRQAEAVARKNGTAIAIGHPNDATAQALEAMVPQMQAAGIVFVDAQSLVK